MKTEAGGSGIERGRGNEKGARLPGAGVREASAGACRWLGDAPMRGSAGQRGDAAGAAPPRVSRSRPPSPPACTVTAAASPPLPPLLPMVCSLGRARHLWHPHPAGAGRPRLAGVWRHVARHPLCEGPGRAAAGAGGVGVQAAGVGGVGVQRRVWLAWVCRRRRRLVSRLQPRAKRGEHTPRPCGAEGMTVADLHSHPPADDWATLIENVVDAGHVPFTHHGSVSKRQSSGNFDDMRVTHPWPLCRVAAARRQVPQRHAGGAQRASCLLNSALANTLQITERGEYGFKGIWPTGERACTCQQCVVCAVRAEVCAVRTQTPAAAHLSTGVCHLSRLTLSALAPPPCRRCRCMRLQYHHSTCAPRLLPPARRRPQPCIQQRRSSTHQCHLVPRRPPQGRAGRGSCSLHSLAATKFITTYKHSRSLERFCIHLAPRRASQGRAGRAADAFPGPGADAAHHRRVRHQGVCQHHVCVPAARGRSTGLLHVRRSRALQGGHTRQHRLHTLPLAALARCPPSAHLPCAGPCHVWSSRGHACQQAAARCVPLPSPTSPAPSCLPLPPPLAAVYGVPVAPGRCRAIVRQPIRFKNKLLPLLFKLSPQFLGHLGNNSVLDEDGERARRP